MALFWNWDNKCGEMIIAQEITGEPSEYTVSLYEGNAFLIMLYEYEENGEELYNMWNFFVDKTHAKKCLGLQKNADGELYNILDNGRDKIKKLRINKAKCRYKDIVSLFAQAFDNLTIEIYNEK